MNSKTLKNKYISFFKEKRHEEISSSPLIPEHDPTVLFTTAGMHPLVPFLMGQKHPKGKRLVDVQKCIRTGDIDEVGDNTHLTFFEMLGNWSLGDYFKKESIEWSFEFLTKVLDFDLEQLYVTCFEGNDDAPKDETSASIWKELGIKEDHIFFLPKEDNWWGPAGETGPCGPDTEIFIDTGKEKCNPECKPGCGCGKYFEIWNNVFMQYNKNKDGTYELMKNQNVDTGMGVERTIAMLNGKKTVYEIETFAPLINKIKELANIKNITEDNEKSIRIIADHLRSATFILGDERGIAPSNIDQGYILRRFIRRSIRHGKKIGIENNFTHKISEIIIKQYQDEYTSLRDRHSFILEELKSEEKKFNLTLEKGIIQFEKISSKGNIDGKDAFLLFQSYGFPIEITLELANEKNISVDKEEFEKEYEKHQELSRKGAEKRFKGGLADASEMTIKLHSATHILAEALREIVDKNIKQKGSNITPERLRFDFNLNRKLTPEEIKKVEDRVNEIIKSNLTIERKEMTFEDAKKLNCQAEFESKYDDVVSVYIIGDFSKEVCGGPHVKSTKELGHFKIIKEQSSSAGVRRIKAILE